MKDGGHRGSPRSKEKTMIRAIGCLATFLLLGMPLQAGEMDAEFGPHRVREDKTTNPEAGATAVAGLAASDEKEE